MNKNLPCLICGQLVKWKGFCKKHYYDNYNQINKERIKNGRKQYRILHLKEINEKTKIYYNQNKSDILFRNTQYRINNKDKIQAHKRESRKNNIRYRLEVKLRNGTKRRLKYYMAHKSEKTIKLLGCDIITFINYIESKFEPGMNWNNWGAKGWHIDHIIPICNFDLTKKEKQEKCFNYTNLQPMWALDNYRKGGRLNG